MIKYKFVLILVFLLVFVLDANPIIFYSTDDPSHNTTEPTKELVNSGWDLQGKWGEFTGIPIASQFFITVQHVGLYDTFLLNGITYSVQLFIDDWQSDLRIVKINETFPKFAQLYESQDEKGKNTVVFGRGVVRGLDVIVNNKLKGWTWNNYGENLRWGENIVDDIIITYSGVDVLKMTFNPQKNTDVMSFSRGDSGGGVFIKQDNTYKLAGVNYVTDGPYSFNNLGDNVIAGSIFDETELYKYDKTGWSRIIAPSIGSSYAIRISFRINWIKRVLEWYATDPIPVLQSSLSLDGQYMDEPSILVDPVNQIVAIPLPLETMFFRLKSEKSLRIISMMVNNNLLMFNYKKSL